MKYSSIYLSIAVFTLFLFGCQLDEKIIDCPIIISVDKERAAAGELIILACNNLLFSSPADYVLKIGEQTLSIDSVEKNGSMETISFTVPTGMVSGIFSLDVKNFNCEGESNPSGIRLAYELTLQNISVMGDPGNSGVDDSHFNKPAGIDISNGKVYVADQNNHVIMEVDFALSQMSCYAGQKDQVDCLPLANRKTSKYILPSALAINPVSNVVYVTDPNCRSVSWFNIGPNTGISTGGNFDSPVGVSVTDAGDVFVIDQSTSRIYKLENGSTTSLFAGSENASCISLDGMANAAKFCLPYDMVHDQDRDVYYVTEHINNSQLRMIKDNVVSTITPSNGVFDINKPAGMAIDGEGNVYIASFGDKRILKYEVITNSLITMNIPFADFGFSLGLRGPLGLAYDREKNSLYVSDNLFHAIYKIDFL